MTGNDDEDVAAEARALLRAAAVAALATAMPDDGGGWPYASLVLLATDFGGAPLLLLSDLAEHTRNIAAEPRVSLLVDATAETGERLAGTRLTVLGRAARINDPAARRRYLSRHPDAEGYAAFPDFGLYQVAVARAHLVAGFGRIRWLEKLQLAVDCAAGALESAEEEILEHMNRQHADAVQGYAARILGLSGGPWTMTGCDPEGCDLRAGSRVARLPFDAPVTGPAEAREALASIARVAKGR